MGETLEKEDKTAVTDRIEGTTRAGNPGRPSPVSPPMSLVTPALLKRIGHTLNGLHWQADFAKEIEVSKAQVTRWLNGTRVIPPTMATALRNVMLERIIALAECLEEEALSPTPQVRSVVSQIVKSAKTLKIGD